MKEFNWKRELEGGFEKQCAEICEDKGWGGIKMVEKEEFRRVRLIGGKRVEEGGRVGS